MMEVLREWKAMDCLQYNIFNENPVTFSYPFKILNARFLSKTNWFVLKTFEDS